MKYIDSKPSASIHSIAVPIRVALIRHSGLKCDRFENLILRSHVRSNNWGNITILTCGYPYYLHGDRGTVWLDARDKIVLIGPGFLGSRCAIYTHSHKFRDPTASMYDVPDRTYSPAIVFPDSVIFEDVNLSGVINCKNILLSKTVTTLTADLPPYSVNAGVSKNYRMLAPLPLPSEFPPRYLVRVLDELQHYSPQLASYLQRYFNVVADYVACNIIKKDDQVNLESRVLNWISIKAKHDWNAVDELPDAF